jgi:hypothetical protein
LVKSSWALAHPMSLTELALPDGRRLLPLGDLIGLIKKKSKETVVQCNKLPHYYNKMVFIKEFWYM